MPVSSFVQAVFQRLNELEEQKKFSQQLEESQADRGLRAQQLAESIAARKSADTRQAEAFDFQRQQAERAQQWEAVQRMWEGRAEQLPTLAVPSGVPGLPATTLPQPPGGIDVSGIGRLFPVPLATQKRREAEAELEAEQAGRAQQQKLFEDFVASQQKLGEPLSQDFIARARAAIMLGQQFPQQDITNHIVRLWEIENDETQSPQRRQEAQRLRNVLYNLRLAGQGGKASDVTAAKYRDDVAVATLAGQAINSVNDLIASPAFATNKALQQQARQRIRAVLNDPNVPARYRADAMKQALTSLGLPSAFEETFMDMINRMSGQNKQ
jgi:hypothetical protein